MAQNIQITKEPGFVRVTYHGDVEYAATTEMLRKVAVIAAETHCKLLLFDIREANYRIKLGRTMRARVEEHFAFNQTARQIEQLCEQIIQQNSQSSISDSNEPPMAQVA